MINLHAIRLLIAFSVLPFLAFALELPPAPPKKTVCLNMIVKNETSVIGKCLNSVKPIIDYWVIVDTGSTDGTQELIKQLMRDIPGELHESPWLNFAHNRNEALAFAKDKADYILFMDADDYLEFDEGFKLPTLTKDTYFFMIRDAGTTYGRRQIVKNDLGWKWTGVLHEYIEAPQIRNSATLEGVSYIRTSGGARSQDPQKFIKDAAILEKALVEEPNNTRYTFYLAQSYKDIPDHKKAIEFYQKRAAMGGWAEEVFWSLLQVARMQEKLELPPEEFSESYYKAYLYRPSRAEPLFNLATYHRQAGNYNSGYYFAQQGLKIPQSTDALFVEKWIYDYGMLMEFSICAYWIGKYDEALEAAKKLLAMSQLPPNYRLTVEANMVWINSKLGSQGH